MTDTTDIKALREGLVELLDHVDSYGGKCWLFPEDVRSIISSLDQLEAERQRSAGSEEELHKALHREKAAERKLLAAQEEIAEMKGDQVPVAFTASRWLDTRCKLSVWTDRESAVMEIGDNSKVAELYDRPQNPVVLPQAHKVRAGVTLTGDERNVMIPCDDGNWLSRLDVEHSIKMAGGIVKDGE